tara:strand:+ start:32 stop:703 length:672 start_codon:yes stop_codon:yes gene_type:complete
MSLGSTGIVIRAMTWITIFWWLMGPVSKTINYKYSDAWVYALILITLNLGLFELLTNNLADGFDVIIKKFFWGLPIFFELIFMLKLTYKHHEIFQKPSLQFERMNKYNNLIFMNIIFQFVYFLSQVSRGKSAKTERGDLSMMGLLLYASYVLTFICITEMYIYLEHKRVDYATKSEKTEQAAFDSLLDADVGDVGDVGDIGDIGDVGDVTNVDDINNTIANKF